MDSKEFIKAVKTLVEEKNISEDIIYDAMTMALQAAYKKNFDSKTNVKVDINRDTGDIKIYSYYVVVDKILEEEIDDDLDNEEESEEPKINKDAQILLEDAKKLDPKAKIGDTITKEVTPKDFGRVATGIAKQVVMQKIREAEKESIIGEFADKEYEMMLGMVAMEDSRNYYIDLGRTRGILPKDEIIPGEKIEMGSNIKVYITKVIDGTKGPVIKLSRKHYGFVKRLFENEVPEVANGAVIIQAVVREAGIRSKVSVYSTNPNIDPLGACIGEKGCRIGAILKELNGERVDLVLYDEDPTTYIKNAMSPAKNVIVSITDSEKHEALIVVDEDNLSLAIGKKGSNIKLASRLTKYKLEVKTMEEINNAGNK